MADLQDPRKKPAIANQQAAPVAPTVTPPTPPAPPQPPQAPAPLMDPSVNVLKQAFQNQDAAAPPQFGGAVGSFPRPAPPPLVNPTVGQLQQTFQAQDAAAPVQPEVRSPIASRNLYPPVANQARMGVTPMGPTALPPAMPTAPTVQGTAPIAVPPVSAPRPMAPIVAPASPMLQSSDPNRFRLPSEIQSGHDFLTRDKFAANAESDSPPGAPNYPSGPLAMPKPSPPPASGPRRTEDSGSAVASLPRKRNQRMIKPNRSRLFRDEAMAA